MTLYESTPLDVLERIVGTFHEGKDTMDGYRTMRQADNGAMLLEDGSEGMGKHMILTGSVLRDIRERGYSDRALCWQLVSMSAKPARLDVALDVVDCELTVDDFVTAYLRKELRTPARRARPIVTH